MHFMRKRFVSIIVVAVAMSLQAGCTSVAPPPSGPTSGSPEPSATADTLVPAKDTGEIPHAEGESVLLSPGHYRYYLADGDTLFSIESRFGLCLSDLDSANVGLKGHQSELMPGNVLSIVRDPKVSHDPETCLLGM